MEYLLGNGVETLKGDLQRMDERVEKVKRRW
jgi:hypothetical protein